MEKFTLKRPKRNLKLDNGSLKVRVSPEAYQLLSEMSYASGIQMSRIACKAILFAYENLEYEVEK